MTREPDRPDPAWMDHNWLIDRRVLQAERDVARADRQATQAERRASAAEAAADSAVRAAQHALHQAQHRAEVLQAALDQVYASTSWRISRPVRVAAQLLHAVRTTAPLPAPAMPPDPPAAGDRSADPVSVDAVAANGTGLSRREQAVLRRLLAQRGG